MPNGTGLGPEVERGEICASCHVRFDGAHGEPVLCHTCHAKAGEVWPRLRKAWLEERAL
jgi:hypothetical protein